MYCCLDIVLSTWTVFIITSLYFLYNWATYNFDYFKLRKIPYVKPVPFFGNFAGRFFRKESLFEFVLRTYNQFKRERFYGIFELKTPELYIRDPELLRSILETHFDHFVNHRPLADEKDDPLFGNILLLLKDEKWKNMRVTLAPLYTKSKLSKMLELITEICKTATEHLKTETKNGQSPTELKLFFNCFVSDVIYSTAFGLKTNTFAKQDNEYFQNGIAVGNFSTWLTIKIYLFYSYNRIMKFFNCQLCDRKLISFYRSLVLDTMKYRSENNIFRPDMIHALMQARRNIKIVGADEVHEKPDGAANDKEARIGTPVGFKRQSRQWSDDEIVAQCFFFFLAGFHSVVSFLCFCIAEILENPEVQKKLLEEVDKVNYALNGKQITYDQLLEMKYLNQVISETLRKWPPSESTSRVCAKPYVIHDETAGKKFYIEQGLTIVVPIAGLHRDPEYFPDPEKFDPERFNEENKMKIKPFTFLPFGRGPRQCIGSRLALMEIKAILFYILSEFTLEVTPQTIFPIKLAPNGLRVEPANDVWVRFKPRI